jgi:hypothetical protein
MNTAENFVFAPGRSPRRGGGGLGGEYKIRPYSAPTRVGTVLHALPFTLHWSPPRVGMVRPSAASPGHPFRVTNVARLLYPLGDERSGGIAQRDARRWRD